MECMKNIRTSRSSLENSVKSFYDEWICQYDNVLRQYLLLELVSTFKKIIALLPDNH